MPRAYITNDKDGLHVHITWIYCMLRWIDIDEVITSIMYASPISLIVSNIIIFIDIAVAGLLMVGRDGSLLDQ